MDNTVCRQTSQSGFDDVAFGVLIRVAINDAVDTGGCERCSQDSLSLWARPTTRLMSIKECFNRSSSDCCFKGLFHLWIFMTTG
jgi:hypothetical protein